MPGFRARDTKGVTVSFAEWLRHQGGGIFPPTVGTRMDLSYVEQPIQTPMKRLAEQGKLVRLG